MRSYEVFTGETYLGKFNDKNIKDIAITQPKRPFDRITNALSRCKITPSKGNNIAILNMLGSHNIECISDTTLDTKIKKICPMDDLSDL